MSQATPWAGLTSHMCVCSHAAYNSVDCRADQVLCHIDMAVGLQEVQEPVRAGEALADLGRERESCLRPSSPSRAPRCVRTGEGMSRRPFASPCCLVCASQAGLCGPLFPTPMFPGCCVPWGLTVNTHCSVPVHWALSFHPPCRGCTWFFLRTLPHFLFVGSFTGGMCSPLTPCLANILLGSVIFASSCGCYCASPS
jgi:hypothetical protein